MNEMMVFENPKFGKVRSLEIEGKPWFVGKDVASILGYKDTSDALKKHVDDDDKLTRQFADSGQNRDMFVINESGLYSLILCSKLPAAKEFKRWVTTEVLPSIRKYGMYAVEEMLENPDMLIEALTALKNERSQRKLLQDKVDELEPKARYFDYVMQSQDLVPITVIAKDYGWSANKLNNYLHVKNVQYKSGSVWVLYQPYADKKYVGTKTYSYCDNKGESHATIHMQWTQKGRLFIYELMKKEGILPLIEREIA